MIELKNLVKIYKSKSGAETVALKGVSYSFMEKGLVFIVGKSGSGKSTMLNILGMLDAYDEGDLIIDGISGKNLTQNQRDSWRALNIGFVFQEFHIIEKYNIAQNIALSMEIQHKKPSKSDIKKALNTVGLDGLQMRRSTELSGGQRQRVAIARALIKDPKVILADEPTGNLDSENSTAIFELLKKLSRDKLVVVISHDDESAQKYADEIVYLEDGYIKEVKSGNQYLETVTEFVEGDLDAQRVDALLKSGKRVVLIPKREKLEKRERITDLKNVSDMRITKLPIKAKLKLSLLAMKSKYVRMIFTVILSCIAISFLAFSDIIGRYNTNALIKSDIGDSQSPFISVSAQSVTSSGMLTNYDNIYMLPETQVKLEKKLEDNDIGYLRKYGGATLELGLAGSVPEFSNRYNKNYKSFFSKQSGFFVEVPDGYDFAAIGVELSGRTPDNRNEIVITNYHLEAYKRLGFYEGTGYLRWRASSYAIEVEDFTDIEGRYIGSEQFNQFGILERYKIVGMLNFDLSDYNEFFDMPEAYKLSEEQAELLIEALTDRELYFGNIYVHQDFIEDWTLTRPFSMSNAYMGRDGLEVSLFRGNMFNLTETAWPYRENEHIYESGGVREVEENNLLKELKNNRRNESHHMNHSFDVETDILTLTRTGYDPFVSFHLNDTLITTEDYAEITLDGNYNGCEIQIYFNITNLDYSSIFDYGEYCVTFSEQNRTHRLPFTKEHQIKRIRLDIEPFNEVVINSITIEGLKLYDGPDTTPPIVFRDGFTSENLATATNKAVIDLGTFRTLIGETGAINTHYSTGALKEYFDGVIDSGIDLTNFSVSFSKSYGEATLIGNYSFEVVGIFLTDSTAFVPTSDFGRTYARVVSRDYLIPRAGNENRAVELFGLGAHDELPETVEGINVWMDYGGEIRFILRTTNSKAILMVDGYFSLFVNIFNIASIVFSLFAILLTYNFISSSINSRKKDIGILRSLGAKRMDVAWIFIFEAIIIAILEIVLSSFITLAMFVALSKYFISGLGVIASRYTLVSYGMRQILIIIGITIVSIAISVSAPIVRITKKQPIDIIKSEE